MIQFDKKNELNVTFLLLTQFNKQKGMSLQNDGQN